MCEYFHHLPVKEWPLRSCEVCEKLSISHTEVDWEYRLLIIALVLLLITSLTGRHSPSLSLSLAVISAGTHWHATYLSIYNISKFASCEAEWLADKVLEIWWLCIYHWLNPFSSSAEERPYNNRNDTKLLTLNPKKRSFSETLGSTWHQSKADLQLKEIHGFAIKKRRQIDLLLSEFFLPDAHPNECIRNLNSLLNKNEWPLQYISKFEQENGGWLCMTQFDETAYQKL